MNYKLVLTNGQEFKFTNEETSRIISLDSNHLNRSFMQVKGIGFISKTSIIGWFEDGEEKVEVSTQALGVRSVKNKNCCASPKIEMRKGKDKNDKWEYREQCVVCCKKGAKVAAIKVEEKGSLSSVGKFLIPMSEYKEEIIESME